MSLEFDTKLASKDTPAQPRNRGAKSAVAGREELDPTSLSTAQTAHPSLQVRIVNMLAFDSL